MVTRALDALDTQRRRRGHKFYPTQAILRDMPSTEDARKPDPKDRVIYAHYFGGSYDFWVAGIDPAPVEMMGGGTGLLAYGYTSLGHDGAEWGDTDLCEIERVRFGFLSQPIERDMHWTPRPASECNLPYNWY